MKNENEMKNNKMNKKNEMKNEKKNEIKNKKKILIEKKLKEKYNFNNKENLKRINKKIELGNLRREVKKDKNAVKDKKYNEYVKKYNRENENENKILNTHGGWREGKKWCITKTEWQKKQEELEVIKLEKPEKEKPVIIKEEKGIIIYDGKNAGVYKAELEKYKFGNYKIIIGKIRNGSRKVKLELEEYKFNKNNKNVEIENMEMDEEKIIRCAIENGTEVYGIKRFYN